MKKIIKFSLTLALINQVYADSQIIYDSTNITKITASAHPDHPNPLQKPGQPQLQTITTANTPNLYGNFTSTPNISPSDDYKDFIGDGIAANPLDDTETVYYYSQLSIKKVGVNVSQISNN